MNRGEASERPTLGHGEALGIPELALKSRMKRCTASGSGKNSPGSTSPWSDLVCRHCASLILTLVNDNVLYRSLPEFGELQQDTEALVRDADYSLKWIAPAKCARSHS